MPPQGKIYIKQESLNQIPSKYQGILHEERYFHEHGQCYTVEPPNDSEKPMPGENHGYRLEFHMSQSPNTNCSMFPGGFDVYIHDREKWWGENPLMPYRGESLHITSGKETHIQIGETIYHSLSKEGEICKVDKSKDDVSYSEVNVQFTSSEFALKNSSLVYGEMSVEKNHSRLRLPHAVHGHWRGFARMR